jgi:hypothetical protein
VVVVVVVAGVVFHAISHTLGWMYSGTLHDKMKLLFSSFDTDNNGGLDKEEFEKFAALVCLISDIVFSVLIKSC